jgi:hypothetical protein
MVGLERLWRRLGRTQHGAGDAGGFALAGVARLTHGESRAAGGRQAEVGRGEEARQTGRGT